MKYILAHDLGTSGNKATLFSDEGKMITSEVFRYDCHYFNTNWAEQDPEDFWKAICVTSRNLIDKARIDPGDIAAVSFSGQMMGCLCVDKQGNPLRPSIIWADQRAQAQAAALGEQIPCGTSTTSPGTATAPPTACKSSCGCGTTSRRCMPRPTRSSTPRTSSSCA